jgi:acyl-CoA reductase-like NAD-dependent aldehyde dehydrogenase
VLASWVPADAIADAVEAAGKQERRRGGKLPPRVVAYLVMALALFADEDYEEVAARLAGTDLPRAFRTADLWLIHAADCCSRYSSWTCCGVRY